jgi:seryl-tRNA synthetase
MIDLDDLRKRPDTYKKATRDKNVAVDIDAFLKLDSLRRELQKMTDEMRAKKNSASRKIPILKDREKDQALAEMKGLAEELKLREGELAQVEENWQTMQLLLPALPIPRVPVGKSEKDNKEVKRWGTIPKFSFEPKDHVALGEALGILDIPRGVKVAGARSYFLKGDLARLHRAVLQCALDLLTKKGWTHFTPPYMAGWECLMGTGFFPGAEEQTYAVGAQEKRGEKIAADDLYLIGTSEVSVCSYHKDEVLKEKDLPLKYAGFSPCFRREAGTYGKDTKGLYRIHQFDKVEQVVLCRASEEEGMAMFEQIRNNAEELLQMLKLPYRVMDICTADMGKGKVYMQDIETYMPSREAYGETHSCSYLGDFQARRLNIKYEDKDGKKRFCHTLNNTLIASPRILIPILELNQNEDGSVTIPEVLRMYMGGQERIG